MKHSIKVLFGTDATPFNRALKALPQSSYKVTHSHPQSDAVLAALHQRPDVVVLDLSLPGLSASNLLARIKEEGAPRPSFLFLYSAKRFHRALVDDADDVADDMLLDSFTAEELRFRIKKVVRAKALVSGDAQRSRARLVEMRLQRGTPRSLAPVTELHDPTSGRLDAKRLAAYLGVALKTLTDAIGCDYKAVFKTPASPSLQSPLAPIHRAVLALYRYFDRQEESLAWLSTPNPELDSGRPIDLLLGGKADVVADMLEGALAGVTT